MARSDASPVGEVLAQQKVPLALLAIVPIAPVLAYLVGAPAAWVFVAGAFGVAVLADWVRRATEQLAEHVGSAIGGLLSVTFGSVAEIILAVFVLMDGKAEVVRAQITGSIIGTSLLGLGLAIVVGGDRPGRAALQAGACRAAVLHADPGGDRAATACGVQPDGAHGERPSARGRVG